MGFDLGGGAQTSSRRRITGSRTRPGISLQEGEAAEGNEKADELAMVGAMMDGREMAQIRASTVQQKKEEVYAALQCAASFFTAWWRSGIDCKELKPKLNEK